MSRSIRLPPDPDRILAAKLTGTANGHAQWRDLTPEEHIAAVTELRDLAAGRTDLLTEQAGLLTGCYEHSLHGPIKRHAAGLLIAAGAPKPAPSHTPTPLHGTLGRADGPAERPSDQRAAASARCGKVGTWYRRGLSVISACATCPATAANTATAWPPSTPPPAASE